MKIKALCGFAGAVCMSCGEVREVSDALASDLITAKYAEKVEEPPKKKTAKGGKTREAQRNNG